MRKQFIITSLLAIILTIGFAIPTNAGGSLRSLVDICIDSHCTHDYNANDITHLINLRVQHTLDGNQEYLAAIQAQIDAYFADTLMYINEETLLYLADSHPELLNGITTTLSTEAIRYTATLGRNASCQHVGVTRETISSQSVGREDLCYIVQGMAVTTCSRCGIFLASSGPWIVRMVSSHSFDVSVSGNTRTYTSRVCGFRRIIIQS